MNAPDLESLARQLLGGELSLPEFIGRLKSPSIADVGEAQVDLDRRGRCGFPEVVYGAGKTLTALEKVFAALLARGESVLATRINAEQAAALAEKFPHGRYNPIARTYRVAFNDSAAKPIGRVAIVTAGTSDRPVAEEARETAEWLGLEVRMLNDVGVAGPQRLLARLDELAGVDAVVVIAGMEGALPSVVAGYVDCPVIGVPTSVGYGASFGGLSALLSMLNSCASNVAVVNIDAGFKGAYLAGVIARGRLRKPFA